jgi:hypothetical protein
MFDAVAETSPLPEPEPLAVRYANATLAIASAATAESAIRTRFFVNLRNME